VDFAKAAAHSKHRLIPAWVVHFGAAGVFLVALIDSSPIPLPIPGSTDVLILLLGSRGQWPWLLAFCGVAGSVLGGYLTWKAGQKGGEPMLDRYVNKRYRSHIKGWVKGHGMRSVAFAALLPPPIPLLPFLLSAGALGVTRRQLLISLTVARTLRYGAEAALALLYGRRILHWANHYLAGWSNVILYSFIGLVAAAAVFGIWKYRRNQHKNDSSQDTQHAQAA
jgi:membrane protein YqaA with SNARE-associated domain